MKNLSQQFITMQKVNASLFSTHGRTAQQGRPPGAENQLLEGILL
jgi:hypothetical protein